MLRPGGGPADRERVDAALTSGHACWWPSVQLEPWNGARGKRKRTVLQDFSKALTEPAIYDSVWTEALDMARRARVRGVTVPAADIVIAACAPWHGTALETAHMDFALLASVDV